MLNFFLGCPCRRTIFDHVSCYDTFLTSFPGDFTDGCGIRHPPEEIKGLDVEYQDIRELKANSLSGFSNLRTLSLSNNYLVDVPKAFENLKELRHLTLSSNNISSTDPGAFDALINAKKISLRGNPYLKFIITRYVKLYCLLWSLKQFPLYVLCTFSDHGLFATNSGMG